jgi:aminomethyltransferase
MPDLLRTPLFDWHVARNARMVPFAGWEMPVQYAGVIAEHTAVRTAVGLFDVGHMARFDFGGEGAEAFLDSVVTNSVAGMKAMQVRYALVCNDDGFILDDVLVYKWPYGFAMVANASNRTKIWDWLQAKAIGKAVTLDDATMRTGLLAVQGPKAVALLAGLFADDPAALKYYYAQPTTWRGKPCVVSRTGYTGEDGFEVMLPNDLVVPFADEMVSRGAEPCGLGARDTLRLEAAMPLYGHELSESIDPLTAGLGWAVKLNKGEFVGRNALAVVKPTLARVGLRLDGKRAAREQSPVLRDGRAIGTVTSGSYVPHLQQSIAMAYVPVEDAAVGTGLAIDLKGTTIPATVVPLPFYKRAM